MNSGLSFQALPGIGEILPGMDLAAVITAAMDRADLCFMPGDILIVAQKIVSKAEGRFVDLQQVVPSADAVALAAETGKDPRFVEVVLSESADVVRKRLGVLIVAHRLGFIMANAGIDRSNVPEHPGQEMVLLLPENPDRSAEHLRQALGGEIGVVITDSFGRPWRNGVVNVAIGVAGLPALQDRRGETDRHGRVLEVTQVAVADAVAAASGLAMGEGGEGTPAVLLRGYPWQPRPSGAKELVRPRAEDLFR